MASKITEEQELEFREAFNLIDIDRNGSIDVEELEMLLRALGLNPTKEEVSLMISEMDLNNNGRVDYNEFLMLMEQKMQQQDTEEELIESFKILDKDGIGLISSTELRHVLSALGDKVDPEIVEKMIREGDLDGDGHINYEEFVKMMVGPN